MTLELSARPGGNDDAMVESDDENSTDGYHVIFVQAEAALEAFIRSLTDQDDPDLEVDW